MQVFGIFFTKGYNGIELLQMSPRSHGRIRNNVRVTNVLLLQMVTDSYTLSLMFVCFSFEFCSQSPLV